MRIDEIQYKVQELVDRKRTLHITLITMGFLL